jgi:hypothetical protein
MPEPYSWTDAVRWIAEVRGHRHLDDTRVDALIWLPDVFANWA